MLSGTTVGRGCLQDARERRNAKEIMEGRGGMMNVEVRS